MQAAEINKQDRRFAVTAQQNVGVTDVGSEAEAPGCSCSSQRLLCIVYPPMTNPMIAYI